MDHLRASIGKVKHTHPFHIEGIVIRYVDYIQYNPVKHGYVRAEAEWWFSSIHWYIKNGIIPAEWGDAECEEYFGEV